MDKKKSGLWAYIKDILGYLFMTFFSACIAIAMIHEDASIGFILFACAAALVGIYMTVISLKKALTKDEYVPEAAYEPGPWLREFDRAQASMRPCPKCGAKVGKKDDYCVRCKNIIPVEVEELEE